MHNVVLNSLFLVLQLFVFLVGLKFLNVSLVCILIIFSILFSSDKKTHRNSLISVVIDVFVVELMVESNVTLETNTVLTALNVIPDLQVTDSSGVSHTVTLEQNELVAGIVQKHYLSSLVIDIMCN